jgi:hypothetical protein
LKLLGDTDLVGSAVAILVLVVVAALGDRDRVGASGPA